MPNPVERKNHLSKALNTYVTDICYTRTFFVRYEGLPIVPSYAAALELVKERKALIDVLKVLEDGKDVPRKRKRGTVERWLHKGKKTYNAVIVKDYNVQMQEEVWVLVHFGKFSRRRNEML